MCASDFRHLTRLRRTEAFSFVNALRVVGLIALLVSLHACSFEDKQEEEIIRLMIEGSVIDARSGDPIAEATVVLGGGGHFSVPVFFDSVATDHDGRYQIEHAYNPNSYSGCQLWLIARFPGFRSEMQSYWITCSSEIQKVDIKMGPWTTSAIGAHIPPLQ